MATQAIDGMQVESAEAQASQSQSGTPQEDSAQPTPAFPVPQPGTAPTEVIGHSLLAFEKDEILLTASVGWYNTNAICSPSSKLNIADSYANTACQWHQRHSSVFTNKSCITWCPNKAVSQRKGDRCLVGGHEKAGRRAVSSMLWSQHPKADSVLQTRRTSSSTRGISITEERGDRKKVIKL